MMRKAFLLPLAALALAAPALAQQMPMAGGPQRPDPAVMERHRADDMATVLGLSAAQRPLLDAFLARPQPPAPPAPPAADAAPPGFAQQLGDDEQRLTQRMADERRHLAAARAFYAALDARQKTVFEALLRLSHDGPGGPHGPHGPHGPGGPGGPGGPDGPPPPPPGQ